MKILGMKVSRGSRNGWDPELLRAAWELVDSSEACNHCGGFHGERACPRIKRLVFHQPDADGKLEIKEVEFWPHDQWPHHEVIFGELLPHLDNDDEL